MAASWNYLYTSGKFDTALDTTGFYLNSLTGKNENFTMSDEEFRTIRATDLQRRVNTYEQMMNKSGIPIDTQMVAQMQTNLSLINLTADKEITAIINYLYKTGDTKYFDKLKDWWRISLEAVKDTSKSFTSLPAPTSAGGRKKYKKTYKVRKSRTHRKSRKHRRPRKH